MKKALVVLVVLTCLAGLAFADTTVGVKGEFTYGFMSNGSYSADGWPNQQFSITATVDKNIMAAANIVGNLPKILGAGGEVGQLGTPSVSNLYIRTDVGGALGLDANSIAPILYAGFGVFDLPGFGVTQYGSEAISAIGVDNGLHAPNNGEFGAAAGSGFGLIALDAKVANLVNIVLAASGTAFTASSQQALIGAYGTVGPVSFEAGWAAENTKSGAIPLGVKFAMPMGDLTLTAMGQYEYAVDSTLYSNWAAGVKVGYTANYTVDFSVISYQRKSDNANEIKATGDIMANFAPNLGVVISPYLNFDSGATDMFDTLEAFAWVTFGATKVRVGYLYMANGKGDLNVGPDYAPTPNGNLGGVWATVDLTF